VHPRAVTRAVGAGAALAIACVAAAIGAVLGAGPLLLPGIPVAAIAGFVLGPAVRAEGSNAGVALKMSLLTVVLGDTVVTVGLALGSVPTLGTVGGIAPGTLFIGSVYFWFVGLLLYGLPTLAFVVGPCTIAWVLLVTWLARRSADNGTR
jgi:hypothetical protein